MIEKPKITVLMSVFNGERYLSDSVESILKQTYEDFEFLIFDDASTDRTSQLLDKYKKMDSRIKLVKNDCNFGLTKSLNMGIKLSSTNYIARQDADDISMPERLALQSSYLDANFEVGLVGCYVTFISEGGQEFGQWRMPVEHHELKKSIMTTGNIFCHGAVMFRKDVFNSVGEYREKFRYAQDFDLWLRMLERSRGANIGQFLYKLRRNRKSVSRNKLSKQLEYHLLALQLANERKKRGIDCLNEIKEERLIQSLKENFNMSAEMINHFKSERYLAIYKENMVRQNIPEALRFWIGGFICEPHKWKIKMLLKDLMGNHN